MEHCHNDWSGKEDTIVFTMASIVWIPFLFGWASLYIYFLATNLPVLEEIEGDEFK